MIRIMVARLIMSRYDEKHIPYKKQDEMMRMFSQVLMNLKTSQNIFDFLKDILNRQERLMIIRRLLIAEQLALGKTYRGIRKSLGAGPATIARVERWLHFGRGGITKALLTKTKK